MDKKKHFWIPEGEVTRVSKELTGRSTPRNIKYQEHGEKLSSNLKEVVDTLEKSKKVNSLKNLDTMVFKVELPEGEKIEHNKELFDSTGLDVKVVKDETSAIVTTNKNRFKKLNEKLTKYTEKGTGKSYFDYIEKITPYIGSEKDSISLKKKVYTEDIPDTVDVQLMLLPNLNNETYEEVIGIILNRIEKENGIIAAKPYRLSDNTPIIRAIIPSNVLSSYENDTAIYRIEETDFFSNVIDRYDGKSIDDFKIDESVKLESLPIVTILDNGIEFPKFLSELIVDEWIPIDSSGGDKSHGTSVGSLVAFRYLGKYSNDDTIKPRARLIDCNIMEGSMPIEIMIERIQKAVEKYSDKSKIFNLSANTTNPIEGDEMSILGYELDALQYKKDIQFVVSAGNHEIWPYESKLENMIFDDQTRIASPADSMLSITVGSVVGREYKKGLSRKNEIAPYSRKGPGFKGFLKPDIVAYAGTTFIENGVQVNPKDEYSLNLSKDGKLNANVGTSFSAPIIAGDLAEIYNETKNNILLSKALLYHNAKPLWDEDEMDEDELWLTQNLYGKGISEIENSKYSNSSRVTFVRLGSLNRITKERINIYMPELLAMQKGNNTAKVTVTCLSKPPIDRTKGTEYLGAYIRASLKKSNTQDNKKPIHVQPDFNVGRNKWDVCHQFSKKFSRFNPGDWQIWLELFARWDFTDIEVPYALVVTIEDLSGDLDIYNEIKAQNRYRELNILRERIEI